MIAVDMGIVSYFMAYPIQIEVPEFQLTDQLYEEGAIFCFDSPTSIRKLHYSWYKANRSLLHGEDQSDRRRWAHAWQLKARKRYAHKEIEGLEADDLVAMYYDDRILTIDKDALQLPYAKLVDQNLQPWGISRVKSKLPLVQGASFRAYQLMTGDSTDEIPRLLHTKDRTTMKQVFKQENPLLTAIELLPAGLVRASLNCLLTPTPLFFDKDPIEYVCEVYKCG